MNRDGMTLLETMVALVILGLVVVGYLGLFGTAHRAVGEARAWTEAVTHAERGMELAKLDPEATVARGYEPLDGGFRRAVDVRREADGLARVTVTVVFPDGGRFELERLMEAR